MKWPGRRRLRTRSYYRAIVTQIIRLSIPINIPPERAFPCVPRVRDKRPLVVYIHIHIYIFFSSDIFPSAFTHTKDPPRQFSQTRRRALSRAHNSPLRLLHVLFMRIFLFPPPRTHISVSLIHISLPLSLLSLSRFCTRPSRRDAAHRTFFMQNGVIFATRHGRARGSLDRVIFT